MEWNNEERAKIAQLIEANLDWCDEETRFLEKLLGILDTAASEDLFLEKAKQEAENYPNPWLISDLIKLVDTLKEAEYIVNG